MTDTHQTPKPAEPEPTAVSRPSEGWRSVAPLVAVFVIGIVASVLTGAFPVVAFILAVMAIVMVHEAGHFVAAKWAGMKATEFFFGFGPRLWSVRRGETEYGIKALPLGGYVKIIGMSNMEKNVDPADEPRTYRQQPYAKRLVVAVAGIITHFVMAFVMLAVIWTAIGVDDPDRPTLEVGSLSQLRSGDSPAEKAGFRVGDRIISIGGQRVSAWDEIPPIIRRSPNRPLPFVVERGGREITLTPVPIETTCTDQKSGFVGIGPDYETERKSPVAGVARAGADLKELTWVSVKALGSFFTPGSLREYAGNLTEEPDSKPACAGPAIVDDSPRFLSLVGLGRIAGQAAESGLLNVMYLLVLINVFVGVFNMVPLLPLDGGHIAIATYERIRSRAGRRYYADVSKMVPLAAVVVTLLVVIGASALWLDITRPLENPFQ